MQITHIDHIQKFDALRIAWDRVYSADPHATIFVSWPWLRGWFEVTPHRWFVLAVRQNKGGPYVAFLPLARPAAKRQDTNRHLYVGGHPLADYTGFVCLPKYEEEAISSLAFYLKEHLDWDSFLMKDVSDPRLNPFLEFFGPKEFAVKNDGVTSCPRIQLPSSWDAYLKDYLGPKTRRNVRKAWREMEAVDGLNLTESKDGEISSHIEALLSVWQRRWGKKPEEYLNEIRNVLLSCFYNRSLRIVVFWHLTTPVAAVAAFMDQEKGTVFEFINCFNEDFKEIRSPGLLVVTSNIRYAIQQGFRVYDFLRGGEKYKYDLGARDYFCSTIMINRRSLRISLKNRFRILQDLLHRRTRVGFPPPF